MTLLSTLRSSTRLQTAALAALLAIAVTGCQNGGNGEGNGGAGESIVVLEAGDAGGDCENCQTINRTAPFVIQGEFRGEADRDCYCFAGKEDTTYLIGVTGNNRSITAQGPGDDEAQTGIDGLLEFSPAADGTICVCVSGGRPGAYILTVTPG